MKVAKFDPGTVESFLDYIYSVLELMGNFDEKRLTLEVLKMAHMYEVKHLQDKCVEHMKKNIKDANVVEIWTGAEKMGNAELKKVTLEYLGKKQKQVLDVPGLKESLHSPQLRESLVMYLAANSRIPTPELQSVYNLSSGGSFSFRKC